MDEAAFITATRFSRQKMFTVSSDRIDFKQTNTHRHTIIELVGKVAYIGNTSLKVRVGIFVEQMYAEDRQKAVSGVFRFVATDDSKRPTKIN